MVEKKENQNIEMEQGVKKGEPIWVSPLDDYIDSPLRELLQIIKEGKRTSSKMKLVQTIQLEVRLLVDRISRSPAPYSGVWLVALKTTLKDIGERVKNTMTCKKESPQVIAVDVLGEIKAHSAKTEQNIQTEAEAAGLVDNSETEAETLLRWEREGIANPLKKGDN